MISIMWIESQGGGGERDFKNNNIIKMIDLFRGGEPHVCTYL